MKCEIIRDLLPAYCDGVCSPESSAEIEQHTAECPDCAKLMADFKSEITAPEAEASAPKKPFKKIKKSMYLKMFVIALMVLLFIPVIYLTVGQIMHSPYVLSFETLISTSKARNLISKLNEGDIDYVIDNIDIYDMTMQFYSQRDEIELNCRRTLEEYYNLIKDKNPKITASFCIYSNLMFDSDVLFPTSSVIVEADGLPDIEFYVSEMGGKFMVMPTIEKLPGEHDELHDFICGKLDFAFNPCIHPVSVMEAVINGEASHDSTYDLISGYYSDTETPNPEYEKQLAEKFKQLDCAGVSCYNITHGDIYYDDEIESFMTDMIITFTDTNGKKIVYIRTIQVVYTYQFAILPEYAPEIIDGGVTPETREMIENLF